MPRIEVLEGRLLLANYYVSPAGNDSNSGTDPTQAWQTIRKVNNSKFLPGDSVLFQGGQTFSGGIVMTPANEDGTPTLPITFGSYGTGNATISSGSASGVVAKSGVQGIVVQDLIFVGNGNQAAGSPGLEFIGSTSTLVRSEYLRVNDVDVSQYGSFGIVLITGNLDRNGNPTGQGGWDNAQVTNSSTHDNRDSGLATIGYITGGTDYSHTNIYVGNVYSYNNTGYNGSKQSSGNGIVLGDVSGGLVERCTAYSNGLQCQTSGGGPLGIWTYDSNGVTIQYCESHDNGSLGLYDGGGFDMDLASQNCIVQYCYSHDNEGVGYELANSYGSTRVWNNNTLRYNVSQNDAWNGAQRGGEGSVTLWNDPLNASTSMSNGYVYGNTIYNGKYALFVDNTAMTSMVVYDNIFYAANNQYTLNVGQKSYPALTITQNEYWSAGGGGAAIHWGKFLFSTLAPFQKKFHQELLNGQPVGWSVDPQLENPGGGGTINNAYNLETQLDAYKLLSTSPLFSQGLNLQGLFGINPGSTDFYQTPLPLNVNLDIGAYQHPNGLGPAARGGLPGGPRTGSPDPTLNRISAALVAALLLDTEQGDGSAHRGTPR